MPTTAPDIVYFGDSLSDNGNLFAASDGVLPDEIRDALGGETNAASDGAPHTDYTTDILGVTDENYAVGAARADGVYTLDEVITNFGLGDEILVPPTDPALDFDINLGGQIDRFEADYAGSDLSDTTAFVLIGANDYGAIDLNGPNLILDGLLTVINVTASIEEATMDLLDAGVGTVVLATLPPVTFFPTFAEASPAEAAAANLVFELHNTALQNIADDLGPAVEIIDLGAMARAIEEDPTGFGLIAPYTQTQLDSDVLDDFDPDQVAFWDSIHPTTATHGVLGAHNAHYLNGDEIVALSDRGDVSNTGGTNDLVLAYGGADRVFAGAGDDIVFGGTGQDRLRGEADDDILSGGADADTVAGGSGNDILDGDGGDDIVRGNQGNDVLIDGLGSDTLLGGQGNDTFIFTQASLIGGTDGADSDLFNGGSGNDTLVLVLDTDTAATLGPDLTGANPTAALAALGITATNVETIEILVERSSLGDLSGEDWFAEADVWGLI